MDNQREGFEKEIKEWYPLAECIAKERNIPICDLYPIEWSLWQQARKQAIPEGYVLVPREPTPKMIDSTWDYDEDIREMSSNTRNEFIYKTLIEVGELK